MPVSSAAATTVSTPAVTPPTLTATMLINQARQSLPLATQWVQATLTKLGEVRKKIERFHVYTAEEIKSFEPIQIHFKVNIPAISETDAKNRIDKIVELYQTIQRIFATGTSRMVGDPNDPNKASAPLGGFAAGSNFTIGKDFANANANMRAAVLIHEGGHFADAKCCTPRRNCPPPTAPPSPTRSDWRQTRRRRITRIWISICQSAMPIPSPNAPCTTDSDSISAHPRAPERHLVCYQPRAWTGGTGDMPTTPLAQEAFKALIEATPGNKYFSPLPKSGPRSLGFLPSR